ncbi:MAG: hypothetical protein IJS67_01485, partial [Clostridia bacterium]|nr:hypothetical protein [Clostridia bacterium]
MFDWFWEFLYGITKSFLRLIDGLISCTNKLCGIESVTINGQETDLISFMLRSDALASGFKIAAVIGFIVLIFFTIARIIMVIVKEKPDMSPGQVAIKSFKSLLLFLFVPAIMLITVWALNTLMTALYAATVNGSQSLGTFLFGAFSQDAEILSQTTYDNILASASAYADTDLVAQAIELSDFDFLFSWITGLALLLTLANALVQFVDRAISIGVLFLVSPFSIASSVLDDGGRFKLWREQILVKFMAGYGIILYLNIYCLLISIITPDTVVFYESGFLNNLFKLLIIIGGGFAMQRGSDLIGNLIGPGAGSRELMDASLGRWGAAAAMGGLKLLGKGAVAGGKKLFGGKKDEDKNKEGKAEGSEESKNYLLASHKHLRRLRRERVEVGRLEGLSLLRVAVQVRE